MCGLLVLALVLAGTCATRVNVTFVLPVKHWRTGHWNVTAAPDVPEVLKVYTRAVLGWRHCAPELFTYVCRNIPLAEVDAEWDVGVHTDANNCARATRAPLLPRAVNARVVFVAGLHTCALTTSVWQLAHACALDPTTCPTQVALPTTGKDVDQCGADPAACPRAPGQWRGHTRCSYAQRVAQELRMVVLQNKTLVAFDAGLFPCVVPWVACCRDAGGGAGRESNGCVYDF